MQHAGEEAAAAPPRGVAGASHGGPPQLVLQLCQLPVRFIEKGGHSPGISRWTERKDRDGLQNTVVWTARYD